MLEVVMSAVVLIAAGVIIAFWGVARMAPTKTTVKNFGTLSAVSLFTGFWIRILPFRLCPSIFTGASGMMIFGCFLR